MQQNLIREDTRTFVGRTYALDALEQFVRTHDRGYFLVRGGPGQGKTALSCSLITRWESVHHLVNRSGGRADLRLAMRSLIAQIRGGRVADAESIDGLAKVLEESLPRAVKEGRPAVIVIDALDELPADAAETPWLPAEALPPNVYFVVTARAGAHLDQLRQRLFCVPHQIYDLGPLTLAEMHGMLSPLKIGITNSELERIAEASQGNPLYVRAVVDELKRNPSYPMKALPVSIEGFFRNATAGMTSGNGVLRDVLALLSVARMPLSVRELSGLTGIGQRDVDESGIRPVLSFLLDLDGRYTFYHARFHEFVTKTLYEEELVVASHLLKVDFAEPPAFTALSEIANRVRAVVPETEWEESQVNLETRSGPRTKLYIRRLPDSCGQYRRWICINNSVGWVRSLDVGEILARIRVKASRLPSYKSAVDRVRLLLVVDRTHESSMFSWAPTESPL